MIEKPEPKEVAAALDFMFDFFVANGKVGAAARVAAIDPVYGGIAVMMALYLRKNQNV